MGGSGAAVVTTDASGSLVNINFHVNTAAAAGASMIDLAANDGGGPPTTNIIDGLNDVSYSGSASWVGPTNNTSMPPAPYSYSSNDPDDGAVTIATVNTVTATPSSYSITTRLSSDNVNAVQTISFGGTITGGTFSLALGGSTSSPINYSTVPATLQNNIQIALNGLASVGTGNSSVSAGSANAVTVTFQGTLAGQPVPPLSAISSLQGTNPTISVGSTTQGSGDPGLTVAAPGVLANDTTTTTDQLTASLVTPPADGTLTLNANGSFTYVPSTGYLGPDSFVYAATDSGIPTGGGNTPSATATVTLHVTPRLSIPTNLTVSPSGSVVVPVIMDNPNPSGSASNGLVNAVLAIDYNPSVFAEGGVSLGTLTSSWSAPTVTLNPSLGEIAIVLSTTMPVTTTSSGSLVLITFIANPNAPGGPSVITLAATNDPSGGTGSTSTFTTALDAVSGPLGIRPLLANPPTVVNSVDGVVDVEAEHLQVTAPANVMAGAPFSFTVTAETTGSAVDTAYTGTVTFSSSDPAAALPGVYTFSSSDAGVHVFNANLATAGVQSITATDSANGLTGSATTSVVGPQASKLLVTAPLNTLAGSPFTFTVTAESTSGTVANGYTGVVQFSKSDPNLSASVPGNYTFTAADAGVHTFTSGATLVTSGIQVISATDSSNPTITGSAAVSVTPLAATHFSVTALPPPRRARDFSLASPLWIRLATRPRAMAGR